VSTASCAVARGFDQLSVFLQRSKLGFAAGSFGVLVTCGSMHEKPAVAEALSILEEARFRELNPCDECVG